MHSTARLGTAHSQRLRGRALRPSLLSGPDGGRLLQNRRPSHPAHPRPPQRFGLTHHAGPRPPLSQPARFPFPPDPRRRPGPIAGPLQPQWVTRVQEPQHGEAKEAAPQGTERIGGLHGQDVGQAVAKEKREENVDGIRRKARQMSDLVSSLLALSKGAGRSFRSARSTFGGWRRRRSRSS